MSEKTLEELISELADLIAKSERIVVFTGAGISTESGLPDFRGPDGLWTKFDPEDFTYQKYVSDPEARKRLWQMNKTMGLAWGEIEPNLAHVAVAEMERIGKLDCIITQNVDGLHQKAGNSEDKVIQLHGNMQWVKCLSCGSRHGYEEVERWIQHGLEVPECVQCGGILKPDAVFFGEAMPVRETMEAERHSTSCDLCIVIGSSLVVYPAGLMPQYAVRSGAKLVIVNDGETELDHAAHVRISAKAGEVMQSALRQVKEKLGID
jgi:NAD-dependent deacetylase